MGASAVDADRVQHRPHDAPLPAFRRESPFESERWYAVLVDHPAVQQASQRWPVQPRQPPSAPVAARGSLTSLRLCPPRGTGDPRGGHGRQRYAELTDGKPPQGLDQSCLASGVVGGSPPVVVGRSVGCVPECPSRACPPRGGRLGSPANAHWSPPTPEVSRRGERAALGCLVEVFVPPHTPRFVHVALRQSVAFRTHCHGE